MGVLRWRTSKQIQEGYAECICNPRQHKQTRIAPPALNAADICEVQPRFESELLLRLPSRLAEPPHVCANDLPPVHHLQTGLD